jgi:hypothetical protein
VENCNYLAKINADLLYQFRDRPNTRAIAEAIAKQLQDVYEFYEQLRRLRALNAASGAQLDGVGDIVVMSRAEAEELSGADSLDDEMYKLYLKYKIFLNTSNGTYHDVMNGLRMFSDGIPLYYSEDPAFPATMFFDVNRVSGDDIDIERVFAAPIARAAGVQVVIRTKLQNPLIAPPVAIAAAGVSSRRIFVTAAAARMEYSSAVREAVVGYSLTM